MLTGLSNGEESAQHCFLLLQSNSHFYETQSTKISLDHIFYALERYYDSFRTDLNQSSNNQISTHQSNSLNYPINNQLRTNRGITQQELQGLLSVIRLVTQISASSEKARMALCEYQRANNDSLINSFNNTASNLDSNGNSLQFLLFGLLNCPIPIILKGEILQLLSSFSLTPMICVNMWQLLENSQIISTLNCQTGISGFSTTSVYSRNDIKVELEEIESREETYPLLRGFIHFIKNLIQSMNAPDNLGIGIRPKNSILGFHPYLNFLLNSVFLKLFYRSYKNSEEKWCITNNLLEIFYSILINYDVSKEGFQNHLMHQTNDLIQINSFKSPVSNSPGYRLMQDFTHDGPILRMLFFIINESLNHLFEFNNENDVLIEESSLNCLKIITLVIEKQKTFIEHLKSLNLTTDNCGIEKLIIAINPSTNKADYLLWILRFIQFNSTLIQHSYYSLNILYMLSNYSLFNSQFLNLFMKSCLSLNEQCELMNSFVEFLEYDDMLSKEDYLKLASSKSSFTYINLDESDYIGSTELRAKVKLTNEEMKAENRLTAIKFLLYYLRLPAPNIAHVLLGFDIHKPLKNQSFFNPGTKINYTNQINSKNNIEPEILSIVPRTCLHSVINILNKYLKDNLLFYRMPSTIDCCYELLLMLCSNFQFNQQLLNYLRKEFDFVNNNLRKIPFSLIDSNFENSNQLPISGYSHYAWIINLTFIEMQNLLTNHMKNELKKLVQLLIDSNQSIIRNNQQNCLKDSRLFSNIDSNSSAFINNSSYFATKYKLECDDTKFTFTESANHQKKDNIIDQNNKIFSILSILNLSQIVPEALELSYFDSQSIEKVIDTCKYNSDYVASNIQLYDLKKLKNILLNEIKDSGINIPKTNILNELKYILQNVESRNNFQLNFIIKKKYLESFRILVESLVMIIPTDIFNLNQRYKFIVILINQLLNSMNCDNLIVELTYILPSIIFTLVYNLRLVISQINKVQYLTETNNLNTTPQQQMNLDFFNLTDIFSKLLDYLLNSTLTNYKVRTHLYATVLNYLMIFNKNSSINDEGLININQVEKLENLKLISANSNTLIKLICSDSCEGLNITTMLGLSLLNKLIEIDSTQKWMKFISDKGYLSCIINTIQNSDNHLLVECFHSQVKSNKIIYITETKLSFLVSLSKTRLGSQLLLKNGLINILNNCSIYNLRSKFDRNLYGGRNSPFLIQLLHQYYQIFLPTLDLCISIINSIGFDNLETKSQIAKFILTYSDAFLYILTCKINDIKMLEELKLITVLICKIAPFDSLNFENLGSNALIEYKPIFNRIHKELLNLICTFLIPEQLKNIRKEIENHSISSTNCNKDLLSKLINSYSAEIASNICSYCSLITKMTQYNMPQLIFSPKLEIHQFHPYSPTTNRLNIKHFKLGILIDFMSFILDNLEKSLETELDLGKKEKNIDDLILIEKKQLIGSLSYEIFEKMTENEKQFYLKNEIKILTKITKLNIKSYIAIIEKCLLLLWRHIEFYLAYFETNSNGYELFKNEYISGSDNINNEYQNFKILTESSLKKNELSKEEFIKFRQDLVNALNVNFLNRFLITEKVKINIFLFKYNF
jgi:nuclear pore complex protein Nup205